MRNKNDIALLRLRTSIAFSNVVHPACLHEERRPKDRDEKLIVSGWGRTESRKL